MITDKLNVITTISPEARSLTPPAPRSVKIELSARCNYHCQFCSIGNRTAAVQDMDFALFRRIAQELRAIGVEEVGPFLIGEPFFQGDRLVEAVQYLKTVLEFPYVFVTSNASLARPVPVRKLFAAGLDSLKWSMNAADVTQFRNLTGAGGTMFVSALENVRWAWEMRQAGKYKTRLYASSIRYDEEQAARMQPFLKQFVLPYVDEHYWLPLYSMGGLARAREDSLGLAPIAGNSGRWDDPVPPIPCWTLFTAGHILADGRMTACCADGTGDWVVGDLKTQSFMECWHSEEFQQLRAAHLAGEIRGSKCERCALG